MDGDVRGPTRRQRENIFSWNTRKIRKLPEMISEMYKHQRNEWASDSQTPHSPPMAMAEPRTLMTVMRFARSLFMLT